MKMFLTRMGYGSQAVITGDVTQIDLPNGKTSGLKTIQKILRDVDGVAFCEFQRTDVVRHPLVQRVIEAFEKYEKTQESDKNGSASHANRNNARGSHGDARDTTRRKA